MCVSDEARCVGTFYIAVINDWGWFPFRVIGLAPDHADDFDGQVSGALYNYTNRLQAEKFCCLPPR